MRDINLYQYLAVIPPSRTVDSEVTDMKNWCMGANGWNAPKRSKPHFTICQFVQPLYNEEKIAKKLQDLCETVEPFVISLSDFGSFQNKTNTIYIRVENEKKFSEIPQCLRKHLKSLLIPLRNYAPRFIKKGHLTIAKNIPEREFNKAWPYWQNMNYCADSEANRVLFLRKKLAKGADLRLRNRYEIIGDYPFLGKGMPEAQLKLF